MVDSISKSRRTDNFELRVAEKLGRAERLFPGEIAKLLLENDGLIEQRARMVRALFKSRFDGVYHAADDINSEVSVGAAVGIADWLFSERSHPIQAHISQHIKWHMGHWSRGSRISVGLELASKGHKCVRIEKGMDTIAGDESVTEGEINRFDHTLVDAEELAQRIDPTGICLWAVRAYAGGASWAEIANTLGITRSAVSNTIRRSLRDAARCKVKRVKWSQQVIDRWNHAIA